MTELDVVIIGGGIQGLLALDTLMASGYACALVTDGDLGGGQTLHSHGFLNTGFGMLGDRLVRASTELVQPYLREHGATPTGEWLVVPPPGFPGMDASPISSLPAGFNGAIAERVVSVPDRNVAKPEFVAAVSRGHEERIIRGRATLECAGSNVATVVVQSASTHDALALTPKVVVVAAGCGSKRIIEGLLGRTAQTERIKHRRVHMICVRGPRGSLPAVSVTVMPLGLMLVAHDRGDSVTWYATPMEFGGPSFDDVPNDASADCDPAMLARGYNALLQLFPQLPEIEGLRIGRYAGYRQDIGDEPGATMCELVDGTSNVIVALPSGLVAPWLHAQRIGGLVDDLVAPSRHQPPVPGAGIGVRVGSVVEDRQDFEWLTAGTFAELTT